MNTRRLLHSLFILHCSLFIAHSSFSQTKVDKLVKTLDSLSLASFDDWRVSPDLKAYKPQGDPTRPGFDDSQWQVLKLDQSIYPDSCWIRKEIVLPNKILGKPVSGAMKFLISVDDYGYCWINGVGKGYFPWDGEFELTIAAKPGERFLIAIKAINTSGPLRLLRAQVVSEDLRSLRTLIEDFTLSLCVGQKLLSFDTYQTNSRQRVDPKIDKSKKDRAEKTRLNDLLQSLAGNFDLNPLSEGSMEKFVSSLNEVRNQLKPVGDYAKRYTLHFASNAHIDAAWLWRDKETIEVCNNTFSSVFHMMDVRPDFTYTQSSAAYYDWMERLYPETFKKIEQRIKDGRWEIIGGMWVEPDCNLPSGESWARHLLYGKRYFKQRFGVEVKIGWNPDSFGYNWNMPQFYHDAGLDAFITQKIGWNETNVFPFRVFWWEGPDGSRILTYFPFDYVNEITNPFELVDWMRQFEANTGLGKMMVLFGVGDHGGGPSLEMMSRIDRLKTLDIYPSIEFGNSAGYLEWLKKQESASFPTWDDELYLEYHQGTYTTQAKMKEENRRSEVLLTNAEKFSTLASMFGRGYKSADLEEAWRDVLFNQFHDILPGSGIRENYIDANEKYKEAQTIGNYELTRSLAQIAGYINTSKIRKGTPVVIFNPLSWERTDLAQVNLPGDSHSDYTIFDTQGKEVASQIVQKDKYNREILFIAEKIPSIGYKVYELRKQRPSATKRSLAITKTMIENQSFRVTIDADSGLVNSILDKRSKKEVLTGRGNELQLLEDTPTAWDAWNVGLTGVQFPSRFRNMEVAEDGPVRVVLKVHRDYLKSGVKKDFPTEDFPSSFFSQEIILYNGIDRIDFKTDVDWWEDKTFLKVAFPVAVSDTVATYEIPYGTIQRSTQLRDSWTKAKVEVPAQRWADISNPDFGVSLLNKSKYGYDIKGNTIRLSLLRSPKWPDPTADRGKHSIEYALYPHKGTWRTAQTVRKGYEYNNPLIAFTTDSHSGKLPDGFSFVRLEPENLVLTSIKKAEEDDAWIIQWYDALGVISNAKLSIPQKPKRAAVSNFLEEEGVPVKLEKNIIQVETKKNSVVTVKVYF